MSSHSINAQTTVHDLLEAHPFLVEALPAAYPMFAPLRNPALRAVMGRVATLERAAAMAGVPTAKLLQDIAQILRDHGTGSASIEGRAPPAMTKAEKVAALKRIIENLHAGGALAQAREEFRSVAGDATPEEIAAMEQELIRGGMPVEAIHRLCDVHVDVFRGSLDTLKPLRFPAGHPIHTYMAENRIIERMANRWVAVCRRIGGNIHPSREELSAALEELRRVDVHYTRKENQLFPALERHGFSGPSKVMWAVHDDIRKRFKTMRSELAGERWSALAAEGLELARQISEMIYKEEKILFPTAASLFGEADWIDIRAGDDAIGYVGVTPGDEWKPAVFDIPEAASAGGAPTRINLATGSLTQAELSRMLVSLPVEISFVDDQDIVRFYSDHAHRIFPRSPGVIGRAVQNCHPPKSLHMVEAILKAFKDGSRDRAQFWLTFKERFILVSYHAVRDPAGTYLGCMEITQDVTEIRALEGEKRLLDWN